MNIIPVKWLTIVNAANLPNLFKFCYNVKLGQVGQNIIIRSNGQFPIATAIRGWFMSRGDGLTILGVSGFAGGWCQ